MLEPPKPSSEAPETPELAGVGRSEVIEAFFPGPGSIPSMELEEGMVKKIIVSVVAVGVYVAAILGIGVTYNHDGLGGAGGLALVVSIAAFVLVMAGVGLFLAD